MLIPDRSNNFQDQKEEIHDFFYDKKRISTSEKRALLDSCKDPNIKFYMFPSSDMVSDIAKGGNNVFAKLPDNIQKIFLSNGGILFDQSMIVSHSDNKLDENNVALLEKSIIKYSGNLPVILRKMIKNVI